MKVDYNKIAPNYNLRYNFSHQDGILNYLLSIVNRHNFTNILEVGCGTGKWLGNINNNSRNLFGLDYSLGMLNGIKASTKIAPVNGNANQLPFKKHSFNLIYCINAIHHFPNQEQFVKTIAQYLTNNGVFVIIGLELHNNNNPWYIHNYFPATRQIDFNRFLSFNTLSQWIEQSKFHSINLTKVDSVYSNRIGEDVFNDLFLQKDQSSQLSLLSDIEYEEGLLKIKEDISRNMQTQFITKLEFFALSAVKT